MVVIRPMVTPLRRCRRRRRRRRTREVFLRRRRARRLPRGGRPVPILVRRVVVIVHQPVVALGQHDHARRRVKAEPVQVRRRVRRRAAGVGLHPRVVRCVRLRREGMHLVRTARLAVVAIGSNRCTTRDLFAQHAVAVAQTEHDTVR